MQSQNSLYFLDYPKETNEKQEYFYKENIFFVYFFLAILLFLLSYSKLL